MIRRNDAREIFQKSPMKAASLLFALCAVVCVATSCLSSVHVPRRGIGTFPPGVYTNVSMQLNLPRNRHSWEIGLWPSSETNLDGFPETHLVVKVTNLSPEVLSVGGIVVRWGETAVVYTGKMDDLARMNFLFDCDTHKHKVKFQLEFEFKPELRLDRPVNLSARGRDML